MEIVFIIGGDNSGKSTLVRSLTGLGRGNHNHPSARNIARLFWTDVNRSMNTFCLISSLNEGELGSRGTVAPQDLAALLDDYANYPLSKCERAILCISSSQMTTGWTVNDYLNVGLGRHVVRNVIVLGAAIVPFQGRIALPAAPHERNSVAAQARKAIDLL